MLKLQQQEKQPKSTLPPIIMEVENRALEDELSLQNCHFPLQVFFAKEVVLGKKYMAKLEVNST